MLNVEPVLLCLRVCVKVTRTPAATTVHLSTSCPRFLPISSRTGSSPSLCFRPSRISWWVILTLDRTGLPVTHRSGLLPSSWLPVPSPRIEGDLWGLPVLRPHHVSGQSGGGQPGLPRVSQRVFIRHGQHPHCSTVRLYDGETSGCTVLCLGATSPGICPPSLFHYSSFFRCLVVISLISTPCWAGSPGWNGSASSNTGLM